MVEGVLWKKRWIFYSKKNIYLWGKYGTTNQKITKGIICIIIIIFIIIIVIIIIIINHIIIIAIKLARCSDVYCWVPC